MVKSGVSLRKWLGINVLAKCLDLLTTFCLISLSGPDIESNPLTANMIDAYGTLAGLIINGAIHLMMVALLYAYKREMLLKISGVLTLLLPAVNAITLLTIV